jgi:hypothetical protein
VCDKEAVLSQLRRLDASQKIRGETNPDRDKNARRDDLLRHEVQADLDLHCPRPKFSKSDCVSTMEPRGGPASGSNKSTCGQDRARRPACVVHGVGLPEVDNGRHGHGPERGDEAAKSPGLQQLAREEKVRARWPLRLVA